MSKAKDVCKNISEFSANLFTSLFFSTLITAASTSILKSNFLVISVFFISFAVCWVYVRKIKINKTNAKQNDMTPEEIRLSQEIKEIKGEIDEIDKRLKKLMVSSDDYITLWEGKEKTLYYAFDEDERRKAKKVYRFALGLDGKKYLFHKNEKNEVIIDCTREIETDIKYKGEDYFDIDDVFEEMLGEEKANKLFEAVEYCRELLDRKKELSSLLPELENKLAYEKRKKTLTIMHSFSPVELDFSIGADYFDKSQYPRNMRYKLFCTGIYGFSDNNEIKALIGKDENKNDVSIDISEIRTMIKFNGVKYHLTDFLELAKQIKN